MNKLFYLPLTIFLFSCRSRSPLFKLIPSEKSGIDFNNTILQNDSVNVMDFENVYNGGGVGIGDFNNDGLPDIYFTGNVVSNRLYLNKGNLQFQDITTEAGVSGNGKWCRGVAVIDINNDGWLDMYVCASVNKDPEKRKNLLYVNQGLDKNGIPVFKEMAAEYGLDDTLHSTMAAFFDYDNDGDLDLYVAANQLIKSDYANRFRPRNLHGEHPSTGRLYRNEWNDSLKHPVFKNVSKEAGITIEGYGHAVTITDINKDGWKDIYVTNDYVSNNILYINNHDGTFTDKVTGYFKHTSANAMGNDINDINNDGLMDVVELDMNPQDNYRKKMMMNANSYQTYQNSEYFGYQYQYVRNTLQLNRGPRVKQKDSIGDPVFSEIAFYSGVAETDWSWTPMVVDFDNDGYRDVIITNGFPKDVTDHDFIAFRDRAYNIATKEQMLEQIPAVKLHNYAFHNNGNLTFTNVSADWGLMTPTFSNGAAYADLDNDGDLDLVINNINDKAMIYENTLMQRKGDHHYLNIKLQGDTKNRNGLGAWIELHYQGKQQVYENSPYRGYLSSVQQEPHFGLGSVASVDTVIIKWPNGKEQILRNVKADQTLTVNINNALDSYTWDKPVFAPHTLFKEITDSVGIHYTQNEVDFIDFNIQKLLPHKFSEYGPSLAVGDLDGNGLDDIIAGGSFYNSAQIFFQQTNGKFLQKPLIQGANQTKKWEDEGIQIFDANNDGALDIYIASGGYEMEPGSESYQDKLYINDGKGNFHIESSALPVNHTSKSCVRAIDLDKDGDLDLFIAGRVEPWNYPKPVSCFIYRNDSKNGVVKFTDVTSSVAPELKDIGLVSDAIWTDFDNDGWPDLILAGEWMPVTFFKNEKGVLKNITNSTGLAEQKGWWTSITAGDFDNDGKTDYIVGNLGLNSFYKASNKYPARIYAKDFDKNGIYDAIPSLYLPVSHSDTQRKEFPAQTRDDLIKQMNLFRSRFPTYRSFATTTFDKILTQDELKGALILDANNFSHCLIKNLGNDRFKMIPLLPDAQFSCINGMIADDFDGDGNLDLIINGNDYGTEVSVGRYDACNGLFLKGDGKGNFKTLSILESGVFIPGNGKALVKLRNSKGQCLIAASENRGPLKIFVAKNENNTMPVNVNEASAVVNLKNGSSRKQELNFGSSMLSQSARFINLPATVKDIEITDNSGKKRTVHLNN